MMLKTIKRTWGVLLAAGLTLGGVGGCQSMYETGPHARTGYRIGWEVSRPPLVVGGPTVTAVTSSGSQGSSAALTGIDQSTTLNAMGAAAPAAAAPEFAPAAPAAGVYRSRLRVMAAPAPAVADCSAQDLCDRLDRIERRLLGNGSAAPAFAPPPVPRQKMPSAAPEGPPCP